MLILILIAASDLILILINYLGKLQLPISGCLRVFFLFKIRLLWFTCARSNQSKIQHKQMFTVIYLRVGLWRV
jgi:hypothetical protein